MPKGDLFTGLAGLPLGGDVFDLGKGVEIRKTYGHSMMPYLVAFNRAEPGKPHPPPWMPAESGVGFDMEAMLQVPGEIDGAEHWEVARAIVFLLRLGVNPEVTAPIVCSHSFEELPGIQDGKARLMPLEVRKREFALKAENATLNATNAQWLKDRWPRTVTLMNESAEFELAVAAMDAGQFERNTALTLVSLWGALEALFARERNELRFRVSSYIAAYVHPLGAKRREMQKVVAKLYDKRSAAVHGLPNHANQDVLDTFSVLRSVMMRIVEEGEIPTRESLEAALFG